LTSLVGTFHIKWHEHMAELKKQGCYLFLCHRSAKNGRIIEFSTGKTLLLTVNINAFYTNKINIFRPSWVKRKKRHR
jgi:hypothetical protein